MSKSKSHEGRDPKDQRRKLKKDYWATTVTSGDVSVYAWERLDRRGIIHVKFTSAKSSANDGREKKKLPGDLTVRDARGKLDATKIDEVKAVLTRVAARLALGEDPFGVSAETEPDPELLTIRRGFRIALDLTDGKFASATRRHDEVKRAQRKLERILGPNTAMGAALESDAVRRVWRTLAREYEKNKSPNVRQCGARQTEVTVDALYTIGDWLEDEKKLPKDGFKRIKNWREQLKNDWKQLTGETVDAESISQPRHTPEEMRKLFGALDDPRRRLFRTLLPACPEGALSSAHWSSLTSDEAGVPAALTLQWMRRVRTPGVKRDDWASRATSQTFTLSAHERECVAEALRGYLRLLETARLSGTIADYPLLPSGPILDGAVSASATTPLSLDGDSVLTIDERFELAFALGGEQRIGQVISSTRNDLTLPGVDRRADHRTPAHGVLKPPSARKRRSQPIALTESQRGWVMNVLEHGYLREYEAAYRAGRIPNYPLFPAERMVRGLAKWRDTPRPLSRDAALKMFYHLEAVAGVEHEPGRGWNGVRRVASDLVEDLENDERVQDSVLANSKGTRRSRYQEKQRPSILAQASDTRVRMRGGPAPVVAAPASTDAMIAALRAVGISLTDVQLAALGAVLTSDDESRNGTDSG